MTCGQCRFWFKNDSQCRRYAPHPSEGARSAGAAATPTDTRWPRVDASDWCGEFQPIVVSPSDQANR